MKGKLLILTMLSCICIAIANVDQRPARTEVDGARGQPDGVTAMINVESPVPGVIETNRKERDVDSWRYSNVNVYLSAENSTENVTANVANAGNSKVRWRSVKGNIKSTKNIANNIRANSGNRVRWLC